MTFRKEKTMPDVRAEAMFFNTKYERLTKLSPKEVLQAHPEG